MTSQQGMLDGFDPPRSRSAEIARVLVDVDLPTLIGRSTTSSRTS